MAMFKNVKRCPYCFNEQIKIVETRDKKGQLTGEESV